MVQAQLRECQIKVCDETSLKIWRLCRHDRRHSMKMELDVITDEAAEATPLPGKTLAQLFWQPIRLGKPCKPMRAFCHTREALKGLRGWYRTFRLYTMVDIVADIALLKRQMPIYLPEPPGDDEALDLGEEEE